MKKKVILLIIILPLIFILTLFTIGAAVSVIIAVPVSGIEITTASAEGVLTIDISDYDPLNLPVLSVAVQPLNAKNRDWSYSAEGDSVRLIQAKEGYLINPEKVGTTKLTVRSKDGGYTDSLTVEVVSGKLWDVEPTLTFEGGELSLTSTDLNRYTVTLDSAKGKRYQFGADAVPSSFGGADVEWTSAQENVLKVDRYTGFALPMSEGTAIVTATAAGGRTGTIEKVITVNVEMGLAADETSVNGVVLNTNSQIVPEVRFGALKEGNASFTMILPSAAFAEDVTVTEFRFGGKNDIGNIVSAVKGNALTLTYKGDSPAEITAATIVLNSGEREFTFTAVFSDDIEFDIYTSYHSPGDRIPGASSDEEIIYQRTGTTVTYTAYADFASGGVEFEWSVSGTGVEITGGEGAYRKIFAGGGSATLTVTAKLGDKVLDEKEVTVLSVDSVYSLSFAENNSVWGLERLFTTGDGILRQSGYLETGYSLNVGYRETAGGKQYGFDGEKIVFSVSDPEIADVNYDNHLNITGTGVITVNAKWIYADYFGADVSAELNLRVVDGGVNVSDYQSLKLASDSENGAVKAVVLQADIMLGVEDVNESNISAYYSEMYTTYDWKYYQNSGEPAPKVKYLIKFTHDVYGNGYYMDGDHITTKLKGSSSAGGMLLFNGPLNFVQVGAPGGGSGMASVKGQDNIVFLAKGDITIDNVTLRGCSDSSLIDDETGNFDLSKLNYVGTTLEVMGNVQLLNSRVSNGRTAVRIFGGGDTVPEGQDKLVTEDTYSSVDAERERYTVRIDGCILSRAREFIIKIGTNRAVRAQKKDGMMRYPYLSAGGVTYVPDNATNLDSLTYGNLPTGAGVEAPDYSVGSDFYNEFVLTDVTLRNSVLEDSGLFTIGIESHFSGSALAEGEYSGGTLGSVLRGWHDLAATSYASVLRLEGDVRLLDWKNIANVDSSTLIEVTGLQGNDSSILSSFVLDIAEMLRTVREEGYPNIVADIDGVTYAHGGIALYGGGLNYAGIDTSGLNETTEDFVKYKVNLNIFGDEAMGYLKIDAGNDAMKYLKIAAGRNDFIFYMYDGTSETDYAAEQELRQSGKAYDLPIAK